MDEKTKRKLMIGIVAVIILGGAGYAFLGRKGANENAGMVTGGAERKQRANTGDTTVRKDRKKSIGRKEAAVTSQRRERKDDNRQTSRRKARKGGKRRVQKKKIVPAA